MLLRVSVSASWTRQANESCVMGPVARNIVNFPTRHERKRATSPSVRHLPRLIRQASPETRHYVTGPIPRCHPIPGRPRCRGVMATSAWVFGCISGMRGVFATLASARDREESDSRCCGASRRSDRGGRRIGPVVFTACGRLRATRVPGLHGRYVGAILSPPKSLLTRTPPPRRGAQ
jgi:hypothetical protein